MGPMGPMAGETLHFYGFPSAAPEDDEPGKSEEGECDCDRDEYAGRSFRELLRQAPCEWYFEQPETSDV